MARPCCYLLWLTGPTRVNRFTGDEGNIIDLLQHKWEGCSGPLPSEALQVRATSLLGTAVASRSLSYCSPHCCGTQMQHAFTSTVLVSVRERGLQQR
jgi:hypothetical protein